MELLAAMVKSHIICNTCPTTVCITENHSDNQLWTGSNLALENLKYLSDGRHHYLDNHHNHQESFDHRQHKKLSLLNRLKLIQPIALL